MINIYLSYIYCNEETDEIGNDEPYVLVTSVALSPSLPNVPVQVPLASDVVLYAFSDMFTDRRPLFGVTESFWGIGGATATLLNPDDAIFLVAMMENDSGDPHLTRGVVDTFVNASLATSVAIARPGKVTTLTRDVDSARRVPTGLPSFDQPIGEIQELRFSADELQRAESGLFAITREMVFAGEGGRYTLQFEGRNPHWLGPFAFGGDHLHPGAHITPLFRQTDTVSAALTIDRYARMNVAWLDVNNPADWQGPIGFGGNHLKAGAYITPVFQQSDRVFAALTIDSYRRMNVTWLDLNIVADWQGPIAFGADYLQPGAYITPVFQQSDLVFTALTVDSLKRMSVTWLDLNNPLGWQGPVGFGGDHLEPGAHITPVLRQSDTIFSALTVDSHGRMNVTWLDLNIAAAWQGPVGFGGNHLRPGAYITPVMQLSDTLYTALTVGNDGRMNSVWLDLNNPDRWVGPIPFGGDHLKPGAHITPLFLQTGTQTTAMTIDRFGRMNVAWLDLSNPFVWQGPVGFGDPHLSPGGYITPVFDQSYWIKSVLTIGQDGAANFVGLDERTAVWFGPVPFGDPRLQPGAHINPVEQHIYRAFSGLTVDRNRAISVVRKFE